MFSCFELWSRCFFGTPAQAKGTGFRTDWATPPYAQDSTYKTHYAQDLGVTHVPFISSKKVADCLMQLQIQMHSFLVQR